MRLSRARAAVFIALSLAGGLVHVAEASVRAVSAPWCEESTRTRAGAPAPVPPAGVATCPTVQPGDTVYATLGNASRSCTIGFLYRDRRGDTYFATGADCAPPFAFDAKVTTWPRGRGPAALDGREGKRIGEFAFRFDDGRLGMSLVRLDRSVRFSPQVCQYGGPTGIATDVSDDPAQLVMVGPEGGFLKWDARPFAQTDGTVLRPGVAHFGLYDKDLVLVSGEAFVEQGIPVMTADGRAVGIAEWLGTDRHPAPLFHVGIPVIRPGVPLAAAELALRTKLTLMTAPLI